MPCDRGFGFVVAVKLGDSEIKIVGAVPANHFRQSFTLSGPAEYSRILKNWFEIFPEKVVFGSDAFPYTREVAVPETYWLAIATARTASAAALAQMVAEGEISEAKALEVARDYFHDTSAKLFGIPTLKQ